MSTIDILVSGASGFLGRNLVSILKDEFPGATVTGITRSDLDLKDAEGTKRFLKDAKPTYFFHLAGKPYIHDLTSLVRENIEATASVLRAIEDLKLSTRVIIPGSAAEYGHSIEQKLPIAEDDPYQPINQYGLVKSWQTELGQFYARKGVEVVVGRLFNVLAKDAPVESGIGTFVSQIREIRDGKREPVIRVRNLSPKRDYMDISDACRGLIAIAKKGRNGEVYNVCSGQMISMRELFQGILKNAGVKAEISETVPAAAFNEIQESCGSNEKLKRETGWTMRVTLAEAMKGLV